MKNKDKDIEKYNNEILNRLSIFLNDIPKSIKKNDVEDIEIQFNLSKKEAFSILLGACLGLDIADNKFDREIYNLYFSNMIHFEDIKKYHDDLYYKNIRFNDISNGKWTLKFETIDAYEPFVCDDMVEMDDGRVIPQIGFFDCEYRFPAVLENDREWMTLLPNETNSQKEAIDEAFGNVVTYGMGLGYFAYMVSQKENVKQVTVVERDESVVDLFKKHILPQFDNKDKIKIIVCDAFEYAEKIAPQQKFDFMFADIWHDVDDGIDLYKRFKNLEYLNANTKYMYWLEKTMKCYLKNI